MSDTGMGAAVQDESAMGEEAGDKAADGKTEGPAVPLPQHLWQRLWQLRDMPERTPEQHAELTGLHEWATKYAEAWEAAPEAAFDHLVSFADQVGKVLSHLTAVVPAAAGLSMAVNRLDMTLDAIRSAMTPPATPPELPPTFEGVPLTCATRSRTDAGGTEPDHSEEGRLPPNHQLPDDAGAVPPQPDHS